jgi:hypothetical protein
MNNKKVKNASPIEYAGIRFKSKLEKTCYELLFIAGFNPSYEPQQFEIFPEYILKFGSCYKHYTQKKNKKETLMLSNNKLQGIKYTPDFYFSYCGYKIYIETKGRPNETYPIRKKIFLSWLDQQAETCNFNYYFFEPHSKKEIMEMINIINTLPMNEQLNKIKTLLKVLPTKEFNKAVEYINKRDFDSLSELINSTVILVEKHLYQENYKGSYSNLDIESLLFLKAEVDCYCMALDPTYNNELNTEEYQE